MRCDFSIKTYGWKELAMQYAPDLTPHSASKRLLKWVLVNKKLHERLLRLGWTRGGHLLTPVQVGAIVEFLGKP